MTIDVEDWFQPATFANTFQRSEWDGLESRVVTATRKILRILEKSEATGTFFVLGWVAERQPELVREIQRAGHEVASHGYWHHCIYDEKPDEFAKDLGKSIDVLEQITGEKVLGYRAPNFSITDWAIDIMVDAGLTYDSSYFPTIGHDRYGKLEEYPVVDAPVFPLKPGFYEIPLSSIRTGGKMIPWSGGGYFRMLPYRLFRQGVKRILRRQGSFNFYLHPWEVDPEQPRVAALPLIGKLRHYNQLTYTEERLTALTRDFRFRSVREFLQEQAIVHP